MFGRYAHLESVRGDAEKKTGSTCLEPHLEDQEEEALPLVPVLLPARNVTTVYNAQIVNAICMDGAV